MRWMILNANGKATGPFSPDKLRELISSRKLRPEDVLHPENDDRLYKAEDTTLFPYNPPRDEHGNVLPGTKRPVNIDTGFQPTPYGSFLPTDGVLAGVSRVITGLIGATRHVTESERNKAKGSASHTGASKQATSPKAGTLAASPGDPPHYSISGLEIVRSTEDSANVAEEILGNEQVLEAVRRRLTAYASAIPEHSFTNFGHQLVLSCAKRFLLPR